jgi:heme oxygenase
MIRVLLRDGTRAHHARAEASLPLLDPSLTRDGYRRLLAALHAFHAPLEERLVACDALTALGIDWTQRRKAHLLVADLRQLAAPAHDLAAPSPELPDVRATSAALGALYVVEGATLGGQLVARHLARALGIGPDGGASFFAAYGERTGPMWREFVRVLERAEDDGACEPAAVLAAARATFDALAVWLTARARLPHAA